MSLPRPYYQDDCVTLYCADCCDILPELEARSVDLILTDPPYAAAAATVTTGFARERWGGNWGDMSLVKLMAAQILEQPCLREEHQVYWFGDHLSNAVLMPYFFPRYALTQTIVWDKDMLGVGGSYRKQTELIIYAKTSNAPRMRKDRRDLVRMRPRYATKKHPAEKPIGLVSHFLEATPSDMILDPFAGSGSTLCAATSLGRKSIGIEIEERYCETAAERLQETLAFGVA